jgi:hypothetical protein
MQEHLAKRAKPGHGAAMSPASRSPALRPWRKACLALLCAAAGGGLRWRLQTNGTAPSGPAATDQKAPPPLTPTADALRSLSVTNRLTSLAAALPNMTAAEIAALVESLAARFQEGGMGPGTADIELLLRVAFTRWAELDPPGMIIALVAPAYQYALTTRMNRCSRMGGTPRNRGAGRRENKVARRRLARGVGSSRTPALLDPVAPSLVDDFANAGQLPQALQFLDPGPRPGRTACFAGGRASRMAGSRPRRGARRLRCRVAHRPGARVVGTAHGFAPIAPGAMPAFRTKV